MANAALAVSGLLVFIAFMAGPWFLVERQLSKDPRYKHWEDAELDGYFRSTTTKDN